MRVVRTPQLYPASVASTGIMSLIHSLLKGCQEQTWFGWSRLKKEMLKKNVLELKTLPSAVFSLGPKKSQDLMRSEIVEVLWVALRKIWGMEEVIRVGADVLIFRKKEADP